MKAFLVSDSVKALELMLTQEGKKENNLKMREWRQTPCYRDLVSVMLAGAVSSRVHISVQELRRPASGKPTHKGRL